MRVCVSKRTGKRGKLLKMKREFQKAHERSRRNKRGKREMSDKKATLWGGLCVWNRTREGRRESCEWLTVKKRSVVKRKKEPRVREEKRHRDRRGVGRMLLVQRENWGERVERTTDEKGSWKWVHEKEGKVKETVWRQSWVHSGLWVDLESRPHTVSILNTGASVLTQIYATDILIWTVKNFTPMHDRMYL